MKCLNCSNTHKESSSINSQHLNSQHLKTFKRIGFCLLLISVIFADNRHFRREASDL